MKHALTALAGVDSAVQAYWLGRLENIADYDVESRIVTIPVMSEVARTFCVSLLEANRRRLLDAC